MENERKEWDYIEIRYCNAEYIRIDKLDLDKIEAIGDVIDALQQGKALVEKLKTILK